MTPNERNLDALFNFLHAKVNELQKIKNNIRKSYFGSGGTTTSDKLQIRKLRLKK